MYKSPIELLVTDIQNQIVKKQDEEIYKAVLHYIPNVDKEELLRALQYDRDQYEKGYLDGKRDATPKWIPVTERLPEKYGSAIVYRKGNRFSMLRYSQALGFHFYDSDWGDVTEDDVTHWMPLPEAPKGE